MQPLARLKKRCFPLQKLHILGIPILILISTTYMGANAQWEQSIPPVELLSNSNNPIAIGLPDIENQLYGHAYLDQPLSQRTERIEKTLFGKSQRGALENRVQQIKAYMNEKKAQAIRTEQEPMLAYLEEKLFQQSFPHQPLAERIQRLEMQVFSHSFDNYPLAIRFKKLTYAMPLMTKEIRITQGNGDIVLASTSHMSRQAPRMSAPKVDIVSLDATDGTNKLIRRLPNGSPLDSGDYIQNIYRTTTGSLLRWQTLPVKVYYKPLIFADDPQKPIVTQSLQAWKNIFSIAAVPNPGQADIVITWDKDDWNQNTRNLLTRPAIQLDDQHRLRTIILISLYPIKDQPVSIQMHILSHELGHAFGIWGHSDHPGDIMYPISSFEINDFPGEWHWRSAFSSPHNSEEGIYPESLLHPSQRDVNTLLKIYSAPVLDLSVYNPY